METHSCILAWRILMHRGAWRATVHNSQRVRQDLSDLACMYVNPNLWIHPSPLPILTLGVYMFVLYIHVFISILQVRWLKGWLIGYYPDAEKDRRSEKGAAEHEMVRLHHWLNGREFEQTLEESKKEGKPGMLQSMGSQRTGHNLVTEQKEPKHHHYSRLCTRVNIQ